MSDTNMYDELIVLRRKIKKLTEEYDALKEQIIDAYLRTGKQNIVCREGAVTVTERITPKYSATKVRKLCGGDIELLLSVMDLSNTKLKKEFDQTELAKCEVSSKVSYVVAVTELEDTAR